MYYFNFPKHSVTVTSKLIIPWGQIILVPEVGLSGFKKQARSSASGSKLIHFVKMKFGDFMLSYETWRWDWHWFDMNNFFKKIRNLLTHFTVRVHAAFEKDNAFVWSCDDSWHDDIIVTSFSDVTVQLWHVRCHNVRSLSSRSCEVENTWELWRNQQRYKI